MAQSVKNLPAMQETWVHSWGQEDPMEEDMARRERQTAKGYSNETSVNVREA